MKTSRQLQREATRLFRLCLVDGSLDDNRVRLVVERVIRAGHSGALSILARFERLVKLDCARRSAEVQSAAPLPQDVKASVVAGIARLYGRGIVASFAENASLIGGMRIKVGSDVYDGSVKARLEAIAARF
jgi:F-type H+-transporting ATPase subunit delta